MRGRGRHAVWEINERPVLVTSIWVMSDRNWVVVTEGQGGCHRPVHAVPICLRECRLTAESVIQVLVPFVEHVPDHGLSPIAHWEALVREPLWP